MQLAERDLRSVKPNPNNPRRTRNPEEDHELTESIRRHGILQPPGIYPDGTLAWGHRRIECGIAAGMTKTMVLILDKNMSESEAMLLLRAENSGRVNFTAFEEFQWAISIMQRNPTWKARDLAEKIGKDPRHGQPDAVAVKDDPRAQTALEDGKITLSDCYALSKCATPEQQAELLAAKLSGAIATREQLEAGRKKRTGAASTVKIEKAKLPLPGGRVVTVAGEGLDLEVLLEIFGLVTDLVKKCLKDGIDVKTACRVAADKARAATV